MAVVGNSVYEVNNNWAKLPKNIRLGYTHGVAVDSRDRVYIFNQSEHAVIVLDRDGSLLHSWGAEFAGGAHGMCLSREENGEFLYLTDIERHLVVKTRLDGSILMTLGVPELPGIYDRPDQYRPTDVAVAPNGDFYVSDGYGQSWIHHYRPDGTRVRSWGDKGSGPGQLDCPHGIWVDTRGAEPELYAADRRNHRIQVFTLDGEHIRFITDDIDYPCGFYSFGGELFIPDLHSRVTVLDQEDRLIAHLGEDPAACRKEGWPNRPPSERSPDRFVAPHAVCVDSHGDLYVVEWVPEGRITKWTQSSR